jgi:hypothetical protein
VLHDLQAAEQGQHLYIPNAYHRLLWSANDLAECCLTAVRLQGLVRAEGAVVRQLSGSAAASPWRVLLKEGEQFVQVRREPGRCGFEADNLRWLSGFGRRLWFAWHVLMLPRPRSCCRVHGTVIESKC